MNIGESEALLSLDAIGNAQFGQVLVAEDDTMFRRIFQSWLENWGYRVIVAEDGAKAWKILQRDHPPELPKMSGPTIRWGAIGGEEFVAVLPACGTTDIEQSANRIRSAIASAPIPVGTSEIPVTVSIGATSRIAGSGCDEEMLQTADKALYQAKNAGRNRVVVL